MWGIGVDIGGSKVDLAHVNLEGKILERTVFPTQLSASPEKMIEDIAQAIQNLIKKAGSAPKAIGLGMAGQISSDTGVVQFAPNLVWKEVPLKQLLEAMVNLPVAVMNDVRAATWGEWRHGAGQGAEDIVCLLIGTGIGGGIVSGGKLITGSSNSAGELGHTVIEMGGPLCSCGNLGCLEALASGWALAKQAREAIGKEPKGAAALIESVQGHINDLTARHVVEAARTGDPLAVSLLEKSQAALNAACVSFVNAFNPEKLIIGGGLGLSLPRAIENIEAAVAEKALKAATKKLEIVPAALTTSAGVVGAASYALTSTYPQV